MVPTLVDAGEGAAVDGESTGEKVEGELPELLDVDEVDTPQAGSLQLPRIKKVTDLFNVELELLEPDKIIQEGKGEAGDCTTYTGCGCNRE